MSQRKLRTKTNDILSLIEHLKFQDARLYEAFRKLLSKDNMTWLISHSGILVDNSFTVPAIVNETVRIIRIIAAARVAPTTSNCVLQLWKSTNKGDITFGPELVIPMNSKKSQVILFGSDPPISDLEYEDRYYSQCVTSGGVEDVTVAMECEVDLVGR